MTLIQALLITVALLILNKKYCKQALQIFVISLVLLILVKYAVPLPENTEHFTSTATITAECKCENPFTGENIAKKLGMKPKKADRHGPRQKLDPNQPSNKIIKQPITNVDVQKVISKDDLCDALESSGFNPKWTMETVQNMARDNIERVKLEQINLKLLDKTGLKQVTHQQIADCYPKYIQNYRCVYNPETAPATRSKNSQKTSDKAKNCHLNSIKRDLKKSVAQHYNEPTNEVEMEKTALLKTYVTQRAELEFNNMINLFQNKTRKQWTEHLSNLIKTNPVGYQILGTDYYIPWDLFRKYRVCFGLS